VAAGASDNLLGAGRLEELEAVAKCVPLAHQRVDFDFSQGQSKLQSDHFADGDLSDQQGGYPGLADINRMPADYRTVARVDANVNFQLEAGMAASLHKFASRAGSELMAKFQIWILPDRMPGPGLPVRLSIQSAAHRSEKASPRDSRSC